MNVDPFSGKPTLVVGIDSPLYEYYNLIKYENRRIAFRNT